MLTLEAIFKIYNIIYAVWIFRRKGLHPSSQRQYVNILSPQPSLQHPHQPGAPIIHKTTHNSAASVALSSFQASAAYWPWRYSCDLLIHCHKKKAQPQNCNARVPREVGSGRLLSLFPAGGAARGSSDGSVLLFRSCAKRVWFAKVEIFESNLISVVCRRVSCRIAYVLNYISYALLISALCFIFLVFHALVNPQSSENETVSPSHFLDW